MERVAPRQVNYDNILPLAIESRANRREFLPVNGQSFSNSSDAGQTLTPNPFCPSWLQRLRIESGGVVIEDINEYARLYAMLVLNQCPASYIKNNLSNMGLYHEPTSGVLQPAAAGGRVDIMPTTGARGIVLPRCYGFYSNAYTGVPACFRIPKYG